MSSESGEQPPSAAKTFLRIGAKPPELQQLPCPRCQSTNTKFCYYNNYNLSQPRYFCKSCRRYWTRGGTLRNVPVGGGSRKSSTLKRPRSAATPTSTAPSSSSSSTVTYDPIPAHHPISATPGSKPEMSNSLKDQNLNPNLSGSFTALLTTQQGSSLGAFGQFGLGIGSGFRGSGLDPAPWEWSMEEAGGGGAHGGGIVSSGGGGNMWQSCIEGSGISDGDCYGWPDLAISTPGNGTN